VLVFALFPLANTTVDAMARKKYKHAPRGYAVERKRQLKKLYALTPEQYESILVAQGGHCAVCDRTRENNGNCLGVDHCHDTGVVRGILCARHNTALQKFGDNEDGIRRLMEYLCRTRTTRARALAALLAAEPKPGITGL